MNLNLNQHSFYMLVSSLLNSQTPL